MKYAKKTLVLNGLAVAIGFGMLSAISLAQEAALAGNKAASSTLVTAYPKVSKLERMVQEYKVDVENTGKRIPITDFVDLIQEQVPTPLNIVVSRDGASMMVPPMRLTQVSVQAALNAATEASEGEINWHFGDDNELIIVQPEEGYASETSETIDVVNVSAILKQTEEASLLSAIEIGLELRNSTKDNVTIKLHKETKLLFVKGIYADIEVVRQILKELSVGKGKVLGGSK